MVITFFGGLLFGQHGFTVTVVSLPVGFGTILRALQLVLHVDGGKFLI